MDLKSGYPFWAVKNGLMGAFPRQERDEQCEIMVLGGGITGALIADELTRHGHDVVVVEERDVAWGSTAASTALIQYEIDTHMVELARRYGEDQARLAYLSCADAIDRLRLLCAPFDDVDFAPNDSLYFASKPGHRKDLEAEFALRARHDLPVTWLEPRALAARYGLDAPCAILSQHAARLDPYRLAHRLLSRVVQAGGRVFDRTRVDELSPSGEGVTLRMENGFRVRAGHVILAAGYQNQRYLKQRVCAFRSSYAYVTDPVRSERLGVFASTMVWESARPYLYMRATGDGRIVVGGEDDTNDVPARRDALVQAKADTLRRRVASLVPQLATEPAFAWAGTFAETSDGLPFFGAHAECGPRVLFAMAYGGNGITYSALGADLLRSILERRPHPLQGLFSFGRLG